MTITITFSLPSHFNIIISLLPPVSSFPPPPPLLPPPFPPPLLLLLPLFPPPTTPFPTPSPPSLLFSFHTSPPPPSPPPFQVHPTMFQLRFSSPSIQKAPYKLPVPASPSTMTLFLSFNRETFTVHLSSPSPSIIITGQPSATISIWDDDSKEHQGFLV